jgi:LmbE family N-acetylglucosaminyl deacetylase
VYAVIGAHPDDAELGAGGFLALKGGLIVSMTNGHNCTRDSKAAREEQEAAAEILGCDGVIINEMELYGPHKRLVSALDKVFREHKITGVITHPLEDTNQEHSICARAVLAAARRIDNVLFFEPMPPSGRCGFAPQMYLDISSVAEKKYDAIECYSSQLLRRGRNLRETRQCLDSWRGCEVGVFKAEAFGVLRWTL